MVLVLYAEAKLQNLKEICKRLAKIPLLAIHEPSRRPSKQDGRTDKMADAIFYLTVFYYLCPRFGQAFGSRRIAGAIFHTGADLRDACSDQKPDSLPLPIHNIIKQRRRSWYQ